MNNSNLRHAARKQPASVHHPMKAGGASADIGIAAVAEPAMAGCAAAPTPAAAHAAILRGLLPADVKRLAGLLGLSADDLAGRCGLSRSTFNRRLQQKRTRLTGIESDTLARYASLLGKAREVFAGDEGAARTWLHTSQPGLGSQVPLEFARTTVGYREVERLLTRIDLGVYA